MFGLGTELAGVGPEQVALEKQVFGFHALTALQTVQHTLNKNVPFIRAADIFQMENLNLGFAYSRHTCFLWSLSQLVQNLNRFQPTTLGETLLPPQVSSGRLMHFDDGWGAVAFIFLERSVGLAQICCELFWGQRKLERSAVQVDLQVGGAPFFGQFVEEGFSV